MPALLQAFLRLVAPKRLGVLLFVLAATLCAASTVSAFEPAQTKTRVWGFDFAERNSNGLFRAAIRRKHQGNRAALSELASGSLLAAEGVTTLSSSAIRFSQSSVNGVGEIAASMAERGWVGAPIDVVQMENGLVTVDNTRLLAAHMTGTPVQAIIRGAGEALPESMIGRFGNATTWGDAVLNRIGGQSSAYRSLFPGGSWATGVGAP